MLCDAMWCSLHIMFQILSHVCLCLCFVLFPLVQLNLAGSIIFHLVDEDFVVFVCSWALFHYALYSALL
jgi:hypothetical protein